MFWLTHDWPGSWGCCLHSCFCLSFRDGPSSTSHSLPWAVVHMYPWSVYSPEAFSPADAGFFFSFCFFFHFSEMGWGSKSGWYSLPPAAWYFTSALMWLASSFRLRLPFPKGEGFWQVHNGRLLWPFSSQAPLIIGELSLDSLIIPVKAWFCSWRKKVAKGWESCCDYSPKSLSFSGPDMASRNLIFLLVYIVSGGFCPRYPNAQALLKRTF